MQSKLKSVPEFLKSLPEDRRKALTRLRSLVRAGAPGLEETMNYGAPTYVDSDGTPKVAFNSQRRYMALYFCDGGIPKEARTSLAGLDCGKSCIRFRSLDQLPLDVVKSLVQEAARSASRKRNT